MKNLISKLVDYYRNNTEDALKSFFLFIAGPIILIFLVGFEQAFLKYYILMVVVFIIPLILNDLFKYLKKKEKPNKTFYILCILFCIWFILNVFVYTQDIKNLIYIISIGILFFILYKITKILR